jgi:hypothetical protein
MKKPKLFISYSHADEFFKVELEKHLATMKENQEVETWNDRMLTPGEEWDKAIKLELVNADIILFLVSSDFIASDYCNDIEVKKAIERHDLKTAKVIPIIIRSCDWQSTLFGKLQVLPKDAKPVKKWSDLDDAFVDVVKGIRRATEGNTIVVESNSKDIAGHAFESVTFEDIALINGSRYWKEDRAKMRNYPFATAASQYFYLSEVVSGTDPTFTITIKNNSERSALLKRIGIEIVCTEHDYAPQGRAGDVPRAFELPIEYDYMVKMPSLHSSSADPGQDPFFPDNPPMNFNKLVEIKSSLTVIPPDAFCAYNLMLEDYDHCIPSKALIRMWLQTSLGEERSSPIYMTWGVF